MKKILILLPIVFLFGCEPERGSDAWCEKMEKSDKGNWTLNDARDFTKYCVLNQKPE
ncbi:DUF3012 domain-containing protein [Biformimicrobium ophioploci]|uniref:DUF3012 domain-containing protein n=1 Tax=Biformimicrobium ophioploci TaxID=3036711 RepID=A0ABQ6M364_9GAMM|nr:DUF3012 domain-containing protein [Microbulbifer sp. NKW57]GMG88715.1 hypothetical protein MNKW57_30360 [Microbulbifer sp. NKW57]